METKTIRAVLAAITIAASAILPSYAAEKSVTLTCGGYTGTETLANFQALIRLTDGRYGFHYADCADQVEGTDVWFSSDPEGNDVLEREIDTWNPSGDSDVWVRIPSLTNGTEITMHWGDASKAQPATNTVVWSDYAGVWHMGKASGAEVEPDATGNGLDATPHASTYNNNNGNTDLMVAVADGVIGGCRTNTTASNIGNALKVPSYKNKLNAFNTFTISGWFYQTASLPNTYRLFCSRAATTSTSNGAKVYNGWELTSPDAANKPSGITDTEAVYRDCYVARVTSGKTSNFTTFQAATKVENLVNRWAHYCVTFEGRSMKAYVDGVKVNEGTITDTLPTANDTGFWIGRFGDRANPFIGKYDEVRMYNGVLSADRVKADYDTMNTPTKFFGLPTAPKSVTIKCAGYAGTETLTDFQALIRLGENRYTFSYLACDDWDGGTDVWFSSDPEGNDVLEREIDTWNPSGDSDVWVRIPSLTNGTEITMHWGDASKAQPATNTAVWSDYAGVWHMGKASGAEVEPDATGNGLDATPHDSTHTNCNGDKDTMVASPDGVVGGSRVNTTTSNVGNALKVPRYDGQLDDFNTFTISGWFYQSAELPGNVFRLLCSRAATPDPNGSTAKYGWEVTTPESTDKPSGVSESEYVNNYALRVTSGNTASFTKFPATVRVDPLVDRWAYYCVTFNGTEMKAYADGVKVNEGTITDALPSNVSDGFWIGRFGNRANPFVGRYDEVRMYNGVLSADRVKADYDTMNAPTEFFVYSEGVATAEWTGAAGNGSVTNAGNWLCRDFAGNVLAGRLPTADTAVTVSGGAVVMQIPEGTTLYSASLAITNCTLGADCDWRGLAGNDGIYGVDLNGHNLLVAGFAGSGSVSNGAAGDPATLRYDVASGTNENANVAVLGNVKVVKTGAGAVVVSAQSQTYDGGTIVSNGMFMAGASGTSRVTGASGGEILVCSNGVFNLHQHSGFQDYSFVLDGGALMNDVTYADPQSAACIASLTLVADSSFIMDGHIGLINASNRQVDLDLGGHTLTLHGGRILYMTNVKATSGKIVASGETLVAASDGKTYGTRIGCYSGSTASDLSDVELVMNGYSYLFLRVGPLKLGSYECNSTWYASESGWTSEMYVYGTLTPNTDRFYGATLQDGATLDLRGRTGCFNVQGNGHTASTARSTLGFATGAAITVNLAGREDLLDIAKSDLPLVVQWTTEPDASFMLDSETARKFKIKKATIEVTDGETVTTVSGLKLTRKSGTMLIVR